MKEKVKDLYYVQKLSVRQVAKELDILHSTLLYRMKKWGFKSRTKSESLILAHKEGRTNIHGKNNPNYKNGLQVDAKNGQRWSRYGISKEDFESMKNEQNNCCSICFNEFEKTPNIDHCHNSKEVRGLLCHGCNTGIGLFKDDVTILQNAIKYLNESN